MKDVVQEVFSTVYQKYDSYDPARPLRPWVLGIAFRVASDWKRKRPVEIEPGASEEPQAAEELDDAVFVAQARKHVGQALKTLPEERRAVFSMHAFHGLSVNEIAEALGAPVQTVYSRLRQAREEVETALRRAELRGGLR